jgi:hypothetical protein
MNFARSGDIDADVVACFPGLEVAVLLFLSLVEEEEEDSIMPSFSMMNPSPRPFCFFPYRTIASAAR